MRSRFVIACTWAMLGVVLQLTWGATDVLAQGEPTLGPGDYDQWERLGGAVLSPDGTWMAVTINRVSDEGELRIHRTDSDSVVVVPFGTRATFTNDGAWLAYSIGVSPDARDAARRARNPVQNSLGLMNLLTGEQEEIEDIQSFSFSDDGAYLAIRRYKPEDKESDGVDVIVRTMATGSLMSFGNVSGQAWQDEGHLLALTIDADGQIGNAVSVFDPSSGQLRSLDTDAATYRGLAWRDESADLSVLKTFEDEAYQDTAHVALAWRDLDENRYESFRLDPRADSYFPQSMRMVEFRRPLWSDDGSALFVGIQERRPDPDWEPAEDEDGENEEDEENEEGEENEEAESDDDEEAESSADEDDDDPPGVEIWHAKDLDPVPQQRVRNSVSASSSSGA